MTFLEIYLIIGLALGLGITSHPLILQRLSFIELAATALSVLIFWPLYPIIWSINK